MTRAKADPDSCAIKMTAAPPSLDAPDLRTRKFAEPPAPKGPPAAHSEPIGHEERVDATDEQRIADTALEKWEAGTSARAAERRKARARLTLGERFDTAVRGLTQASTVGAASLERVSRSAENEGDPGPPRAQTPQIRSALRIVEYQVEALERELDAERGHDRAQDAGRMTCEEKDKEIWKLEGLTHGEVSRTVPHLAPSAEVARRARAREADRRMVKIDSRGRVTGKVFEGEARDEWDAA